MKARINTDGSVELDGQPDEIALFMGNRAEPRRVKPIREEPRDAEPKQPHPKKGATKSIWRKICGGVSMFKYIKQKIDAGWTREKLHEDLKAKAEGLNLDTSKVSLNKRIATYTGKYALGKEYFDKMMKNDKTERPVAIDGNPLSELGD